MGNPKDQAPGRRTSGGHPARGASQARGNAARSGNPARRAAAGAGRSGPTTPGRTQFEQASRPWLARLGAVPRWLLLVGVLALLLAGLLLTGVAAAVCLLLLAAFMSWLAALSWPALNTGARLMRVAVVALVLASAVIKLLTD